MEYKIYPDSRLTTLDMPLEAKIEMEENKVNTFVNDIEAYIKELESNGYIGEKGQPLKCSDCDSSSLESKYFYEDFIIYEIEVYCKDCGKKIGNWSYGSWGL